MTTIRTYKSLKATVDPKVSAQTGAYGSVYLKLTIGESEVQMETFAACNNLAGIYVLSDATLSIGAFKHFESTLLFGSELVEEKEIN